MNQDLSTNKKTVYSVPSDQGDHRISALLKKFEELDGYTVSVESSTLEDSYNKAIKSTQSEEIDYIHKNKHLRKLRETTGQLSTSM